MTIPKISLITITFNSDKTIEDTIKSVINQDYENLEYIIVDGGSKDNTLSIVEKYKNKISKIISEPDRGISDAFNKGINLASGEIIGIINSDDILLPNALQAIADNYDPDISVYSENVIIWDEESDYKVREFPDLKFDFWPGHKVAHQGRFVTKNAYVTYGLYNVELKYMMDYDLLLRFYRKGLKFKHVDHDAALYRLGGATSNSIRKKRNDIKTTILNNYHSYPLYIVVLLMQYVKYYIKQIVSHLFGSKIRLLLRFKKM